MNATRTRISNWRNRRTLARGRRPRLTQAADQVRSRAPLYRDRVNRATGRPHRDDRELGRTSDASLAARQESRDRNPRNPPPSGREAAPPAREHASDAYRSAGTPDPFRPWMLPVARARTGRSR